MESNTEHTHRSAILKKIQEGSILMRPKTYFTVRLVLVGVLALLVFLLTVSIASFISFSVRASGEDALLGFGNRGIETFFLFFPWTLVVCDVILAVLLEHMLRYFKFGYRVPVLYLLLGLVMVATACGLFVDRGTSLHDTLRDRADKNELPFFNNLYQNAHRPPPPERGVCRCSIVSLDGETITVRNDDPRAGTSTFTVILPPNSPATSTLKVGDTIFIAGNKGPHDFDAYGFQRVHTNNPPLAPVR